MNKDEKSKKEFAKKPFNSSNTIKEGDEFILDIKRMG